MKTTLLSAAVLMLFAAGAARAQQGDRPCKADAEKFCKDVKPGEGRIVDCLKAHEAELSADCKANGMGVRGKGGAKGQGAGRAMGPRGNEPCRADMEKFCKDVKPGEGRIIECMKAHEAEFSEGCKAETAKRREEMAKKNPCLADIEKLCKDVKPGEGRVIKCLKEHEAELSDACKARQAEAKERRGNRGKMGPGRRPGIGRGNPGGMPGDEPAPAGAPETGTK